MIIFLNNITTFLYDDEYRLDEYHHFSFQEELFYEQEDYIEDFFDFKEYCDLDLFLDILDVEDLEQPVEIEDALRVLLNDNYTDGENRASLIIIFNDMIWSVIDPLAFRYAIITITIFQVIYILELYLSNIYNIQIFVRFKNWWETHFLYMEEEEDEIFESFFVIFLTVDIEECYPSFESSWWDAQLYPHFDTYITQILQKYPKCMDPTYLRKCMVNTLRPEFDSYPELEEVIHDYAYDAEDSYTIYAYTLAARQRWFLPKADLKSNYDSLRIKEILRVSELLEVQTQILATFSMFRRRYDVDWFTHYADECTFVYKAKRIPFYTQNVKWAREFERANIDTSEFEVLDMWEWEWLFREIFGLHKDILWPYKEERARIYLIDAPRNSMGDWTFAKFQFIDVDTWPELGETSRCKRFKPFDFYEREQIPYDFKKFPYYNQTYYTFANNVSMIRANRAKRRRGVHTLSLDFWYSLRVNRSKNDVMLANINEVYNLIFTDFIQAGVEPFTVLDINMFEFNIFYDSPVSRQYGFQDPATPIMEGIIDLHHDLMFFLVVVCIFVVWMLARILYFFINRNNEIHVPIRFTHHTTLEVVWTIIPSLILILIAVPSFALLYAMDEVINPSITIKTVGHQWYWSYEYSDQGVLAQDQILFDSYMLLEEDLTLGYLRLLEVDNRVVLPSKVHVRLLITAADVLHSWAVPSLGIKLDACPGRLNQVGVYIKRNGTFYGQCSEICGVNHAFMPITVDAVSMDNYLQWVSSKLEENL
jgi:cytochrome c oxidase subunit 2